MFDQIRIEKVRIGERIKRNTVYYRYAIVHVFHFQDNTYVRLESMRLRRLIWKLRYQTQCFHEQILVCFVIPFFSLQVNHEIVFELSLRMIFHSIRIEMKAIDNVNDYNSIFSRASLEFI